MKIFVDTAVVDEIKKVAHLADGVTTNPTLIAKSGRKFEEVITEITTIVDGPISAEVISLDHEGMLKEARVFAKIHSNIVIKIPMTFEGMIAVKQLSKENIKTNVTLVFSANQALLAAKAGASYVSPFVGRLDDIGQDGMLLIEEIMGIYKNYGYETQVIVASIRSPTHVKQAALLGAHVATIPPNIIEQMLKHTLTDKGIEAFLKDWEKTKK